MSAIINCFLNPFNNDVNTEEFNNHINLEVKKIKEQFYTIVREQNTPNNGELTQDDNDDLEDIDLFFNIKNVPTSSINRSAMINLKELILPKDIWNISIQDVSLDEYKGINVNDYFPRKENIHYSYIYEDYGPVEGKGKLEALKDDFIKCFNYI